MYTSRERIFKKKLSQDESRSSPEFTPHLMRGEDDEGGNEACADEAGITCPSGDDASGRLPNGARK